MTAFAGKGKPQQLALPVQLPDDAIFATWVSSDDSVKTAVRAFSESGDVGRGLFVYGAAGVGKTHLLHAACQAASQLGRRVMYLPCRELTDDQHVGVLDGLENFDLVCLDDLDAVVTSRHWCEALFAFHNRVTDSGGAQLLMTACAAPANLDVQLPDLRSRLQLAAVHSLSQLTDDDRVGALQAHAQHRGLKMTSEVAQFLVHRIARDMPTLVAALDQLDHASMASQRRLTIPFVKETLEL